MQLQNTIAHIERLILSSRKVKNEAPGDAVSAAAAAARDMIAAGAAMMDSDATGAGDTGRAVDSEDGGGGAVGGKSSSRLAGSRIPRAVGGRQQPLTLDRTAMMSRRQSTSFFDTKPVFSARDSTGSFTKAWNGAGAGAASSTGSSGGSSSGRGAAGESGDGKRRPMTARAATARRQSEHWGAKGNAGIAADDGAIGTPPTVDGSAGSSSGSPSDGWVFSVR